MVQGRSDVDLSRSFPAPRECLWTFWTEPQELGRWWWPARFRTTYTVDLREDGEYCFQTEPVPDLGVLCLSGVYLEVAPPERLRYTWQWAGETAGTVVCVGFDGGAASTGVRVQHSGFASEGERDNHIIGWTDCLNRLEALLAG
ncbi:MAG TPA: SRPBCC domain-containing protein [Chloroflexota bacterium]|nr:SRPBCC domain-containing protein [Chloroflexota bacterium]